MKKTLGRLLATSVLLVGIGFSAVPTASADANGAPYVVTRRAYSLNNFCTAIVTEYSNGDTNVAYFGFC